MFRLDSLFLYNVVAANESALPLRAGGESRTFPHFKSEVSAVKIGIALTLVLFGTSTFAHAQNQPATAAQDLLQSEPETQLQDKPLRQPAAEVPSTTGEHEPPSNMQTGVTIDRYIGDAAKAPSRQWHNVMFTQNILRRGDPDPTKPGDPGAVLRYNKSLDLATLPAKNITPLLQLPDQFIMYVESGQGRLDDGKQYWDLHEGVAILMPPNALHRFTNTGAEPLRMLVLTYGMDGVTPRKDILVRDTNLMAMTEDNVHWSNMSKYIFLGPDGLSENDHVLLVYMGPMTIAGPHAHVQPQEEIWTKVSDGPSVMQVGSEVRNWTPNMAVLPPPNGKTVHAAMNLSPDKIQYWFYFSRLRFTPPATPATPPNPFIAEAVTRSNIAGKPLSSLPADAYHW
jgi:mannose-6-phosphate isomerase-like protein (cupin superfamily)